MRRTILGIDSREDDNEDLKTSLSTSGQRIDAIISQDLVPVTHEIGNMIQTSSNQQQQVEKSQLNDPINPEIIGLGTGPGIIRDSDDPGNEDTKSRETHESLQTPILAASNVEVQEPPRPDATGRYSLQQTPSSLPVPSSGTHQAILDGNIVHQGAGYAAVNLENGLVRLRWKRVSIKVHILRLCC